MLQRSSICANIQLAQVRTSAAASNTNPRSSPLCSAWREHYPTRHPPRSRTLCAAMLPVYGRGSFTPVWPRVLSTGMDMGALTAPRCTAPFKRQHSASLQPPPAPPVCHRACTGSLPRASRQADQGRGPDVRSGEGTLVHCAEALQYGSTSVSSAGTQPAPLGPAPSSRLSYIHTMYIKVLLQHFIFPPQTLVCARVCARATTGPWALEPALPFSAARCIIHSICPSVPLFGAASIQLLT